MPFTLSHIAAVLPFKRFLRRYHVLSAVIVGSMVPDFGWLTPWRPARFETHSLMSLVTFSLPVGLATFWLFQRFMKPTLLELLPDAAYVRASAAAVPASLRDPRQWALAAVGILLGAITHLVWDAFTHEGALGLRMILALDDPEVAVGAHRLGGARLLQDLSSVIGLVVVTAFCLYELRPGAAAVPRRRLAPDERRLWVACYVATATAVSAGLFFARYPRIGAGLSIPLGRAGIAILRGIAIALLALSFALRVRLRKRQARPTAPPP